MFALAGGLTSCRLPGPGGQSVPCRRWPVSEGFRVRCGVLRGTAAGI